MAKARIPIPPDTAALVQHESNRTCCVCQIPGKPYQIHHIDEDPSNNDPSNLALLCLDHHNETQLKGGFGRKLDAHQINLFKEEWIATVQKRKKRASDRVIEAMSEISGAQPAEQDAKTSSTRFSHLGKFFKTTDEMTFVWQIPKIVALAFELIDQQTGNSTTEMQIVSDEQCGVFEEIWIHFMMIRQPVEKRDIVQIYQILERYQQVTSEIFWKLEFPDDNHESGGSIRFLDASHDRFDQVSRLLLRSIKHAFASEFGGVDEKYHTWEQELLHAITGC